MRIPPRATSRNRTWKPLNSDPTTKNMPNGFLGYSISGRNDGSSRKDNATSAHQGGILQHRIRHADIAIARQSDKLECEGTYWLVGKSCT